MKRLYLLLGLFLISVSMLGQNAPKETPIIVQFFQCDDAGEELLESIGSQIHPLWGSKIRVELKTDSTTVSWSVPKQSESFFVADSVVQKPYVLVDAKIGGGPKNTMMMTFSRPGTPTQKITIAPQSAELADYPVTCDLGDDVPRKLLLEDEHIVASAGDICKISVENGCLFEGDKKVGKALSITDNVLIVHSVFDVKRKISIEFLSDEDLLKKMDAQGDRTDVYINCLVRRYRDLLSKYELIQEKIEFADAVGSEDVDVFAPNEYTIMKEIKVLVYDEQSGSISSGKYTIAVWDLMNAPLSSQSKLKLINDAICLSKQVECLENSIGKYHAAAKKFFLTDAQIKQNIFSFIEVEVYAISDAIKVLKGQASLFSEAQYQYIDDIHNTLRDIYSKYSIYE